jgi:conjugative relaxase-like TrwC/TraI family protein
MMSVSAMGSGAGGYYIGLAAEDYYLAGSEPPGLWSGQGAERLDLTENGGRIEKEAFLRLFDGYEPLGTGIGLVQNAGQERRQPGWDLTLSSPKSVSILWALGNPETRRAIEAVHSAAVKEALQFIEEEHTWTRRGNGGRDWEQAGLVIATFEHGTSRAQDPQLHTHALVLNLGLREDGTFGALVSKPFYQARIAAGTIFQLALADGMQKLGFSVERTLGAWGNTFEVVGVPKELIDAFSTRRQEIDQALQARGESGPRAAALAALDTREAKQHLSREELFERCAIVGHAHGFTVRDAEALRQGELKELAPKQMRETLNKTLARAIDQLTAEHSHFSEQDLLRAVLSSGLGTGLSASLLRTAVRHQIGTAIPVEQNGIPESRKVENERDLLYLGEKNSDIRYTTRGMFQLEKSLLSDVDAMRNRRDPSSYSIFGVRERAFQQAIRRSEKKATDRARQSNPEAQPLRFSDEQRAAVAHITRKTGDIAVLSGMAGTGKTAVLDAARRAWETSGFRVIGAAVAGKAARGLETDSGIESFTVAQLLYEMDRGFDYRPSLKQQVIAEFLYATWQINGKTRKKLLGELHQPTSRIGHEWKYATHKISKTHRDFLNLRLDREKFRLDPRTVVVVDEAGMLGTRFMAALVTIIKEAGAKLVLVGDRKQIQPIEAGGPFRAIEHRIGATTLTEMIRQEPDLADPNPLWRREVVKDFASGNAGRALNALQERGYLHIAEDRISAMQDLVLAWRNRGAAAPTDNFIFAGMREEVRGLNRMAQSERQAAGLLGIRNARIDGETIYEKDRVLLTERSRSLGVENGDLGTVKEVNTWRHRLLVMLDRGGEVSIPYKNYNGVSLGYAMTTHKGQGVTVKNTFILCGGSMADLHLSYVQTSRARQETHLFTERILVWDRQRDCRVDRTLEQLSERMSQDRQKDMVHDVLRETLGARESGKRSHSY